jgi:hypothetical protein
LFDSATNKYALINSHIYVNLLKNNQENFNFLDCKNICFLVSEDDLEQYINSSFEMMGIYDDEDHKIKVRDNFEYDYLVKTDEKNTRRNF